MTRKSEVEYFQISWIHLCLLPLKMLPLQQEFMVVLGGEINILKSGKNKNHPTFVIQK